MKNTNSALLDNKLSYNCTKNLNADGPSEFSIQEFFEKDHDGLDGIFQEYIEYKKIHSSKAAERFFAFNSRLHLHFLWEEEILFPLYEKKSGIFNGPTSLFSEEHESIHQLLDLIQNKIQCDSQATWHDEQILLIALAQHHLKEEDVIYPALDRLLTPEEKLQVFLKMQKYS